MTADLATAYLYSPIGMMELLGSEAGLAAVRFLASEDEAVPPTAPAALPDCLREAHRQLDAYFRRELRDFDLTHAPVAGTDFQRQVWAALLGIGYGRTTSN